MGVVLDVESFLTYMVGWCPSCLRFILARTFVVVDGCFGLGLFVFEIIGIVYVRET